MSKRDPKTVKVERRKGLKWDILFWLMFFTISPVQLICFWISRAFAVISDLMQELCYRAWFKKVK